MTKKLLMLCLVIVMMSAFPFSVPSPILFAEPQKNPPKPLPQVFVWTSLSMGLSGHSTSVAMGEGIRKITGVPVKVIPDPTDLGGWLPVVTGKAQATFRATSTSYVYSAGIGPVFGLPEWGPQRVRMIWQMPLVVGYATTKDTGIKSFADLKGKRIPDFRGWCSGRIELMGIFAAFNIKKDDVVWVPITGSADSVKALIEGKIDMAVVTPGSSLGYEANSKKGLVWFEGPKDPEGIKRWLNNIPFFTLLWWDDFKDLGVWWDAKEGRFKKLSPEAPLWSSGLRYLVLSHEKLDSDWVYLMTKGIWESYDFYKGMHSLAMKATHEEMLDYTVAMDPYHEGTIRYLKEIGKWTAEHERYQQEKLALEARRIAAWEEAAEEAKKKGLKLNDPAWYDEEKGFCIQFLRDKGLIPIPEIKYHPYKGK